MDDSMKKPPGVNYDFRIKYVDDKPYIWDIIRQKYVLLSPEEWVRQHLIWFLVKENQYPKGRISVEKKLCVNDKSRRYDLVVHNQEGKPVLLAECKRPGEKIDERVIRQVASYNLVLQVHWLLLTNGEMLHCIKIQPAPFDFQFVESLPPYDQL